jgi:hypothetical protein
LRNSNTQVEITSARSATIENAEFASREDGAYDEGS